MTKSKARPKWTVLYNVAHDGSPWIGTGWEFFDSEMLAVLRYDELNKSKNCSATKRPYHEKTDFPHLGAVHRM